VLVCNRQTLRLRSLSGKQRHSSELPFREFYLLPLSNYVINDLWFSVDDMYEFFMHWSPSVPGTDDEVGLTDRGFIAMEASPSGVIPSEDLTTTTTTTGGCNRQSSKQWQVSSVCIYTQDSCWPSLFFRRAYDAVPRVAYIESVLYLAHAQNAAIILQNTSSGF